VVALVFCWLAGSLVCSSTALAFLTSMSEKHKSASPSAVQVKNRRKTIHIEENLLVISRREKGEGIVRICRNARLTDSSIHTIRDNADRMKESAKLGTKVFVCVVRLPQSYLNEPYQNYGCESLIFLLH
jgi:hypothetical protein